MKKILRALMFWRWFDKPKMLTPKWLQKTADKAVKEENETERQSEWNKSCENEEVWKYWTR